MAIARDLGGINIVKLNKTRFASKTSWVVTLNFL